MPMVSCLMPTYNKCPVSKLLVEEAIESFLRQTYQDAELLICNDTPGQVLTCSSPRVRIINLPTRFPSLGEKLNAMTEEARGQIICRWDDDDINLPWGLTWRHALMETKQLDYVCPKRFWATNGPKTSFGYGSFAQCMYRKEAHKRVGGYKASSFGEDADFENRVAAAGLRVELARIPMEETFYFYRWGTGSEHLSGYGSKGKGWDRIGARTVVPGIYDLQPRWQEDYELRARKAMEDAKRANKDSA